MTRSTKARLVATGALLGACPLLNALFSRLGTRCFPVYRTCSRWLMALLARLASVAPFALWDTGALVLLLVALGALVWLARRHRPLLPWLSVVLLPPALAAFLFVGGWALNHYAPPLAQELELEVRDTSTDELAEATEAYLLRAAALAPQVPRDASGMLAPQDFYELAAIAGRSYEPLSARFPLFEGPTDPVKALLVWGEPLLYSGHTGIFFAPTGESCVPLGCPAADLPFIMCHEAAHRLGLASEQEANFAAFLACDASDDVRFAYAGAYNAFVYCHNALARTDPERATTLVTDLAQTDAGAGVALVWADRVATHEQYAAYDGPFERVGTTVNDHYLKGFGETEGVRSYGLVVDYLIAWQQAGGLR